MKKLIILVVAFLILNFVSCSKEKSFVEEPTKEEPMKPDVDDWKDGGAENIDMYPD